MDLDAYLARIGHEGPLSVDARTLAALQRAHLLAVPFENLDIIWGNPIVLDVTTHFAKIVERHRGGFCYEQNDLFAWALRTIGFRVTRLGAGVWGERDGAWDYNDEASHLLLRVDLDEPWVADVGFGENFRAPLRLVDGLVQEQPPRTYRLDREAWAGGARWTLSSRDTTGLWTPSYRFVDVPRPLPWFADRCHFLQTSPTTFFTQKRLCSLATEAGRITLSGNEWIESDLAGNKTVTPIATETEAERLLSTRLGVATPAHARTTEEH